MHNAAYAADALVAWFTLLSDSPLRFSLPGKPSRVYRRFARDCFSKPLVETIKGYSRLADRLLSLEAIHHEGSVERVFIEDFIGTPVFKEYHEFFKTGNAVILRFLVSFCVFLKKAHFEVDNLQSVAFRDWLEVEERLALPLPSDFIVPNLRTIVATILPRPNRSAFFPKHGPGQVSEGSHKSVDLKHALMAYDGKARRLYGSLMFSVDDALGYAKGVDVVHPHETVHSATLRFVPKDISKNRSICMEPANRMFAQQGVLAMMLDAFDEGPISRFCTLRDQTRNQRFAEIGSTYLCLDTIDLSSASDSVGVDLVKAIFPRSWLFYLLVTRTSSVATLEGEITLRKFAPMGSALCFPTQCVIFLSVVLLASLRYRYGMDRLFTSEEVWNLLDSFSKEPFSKRLFEPSVYGDDVICDSRVTDDVLQILGDLRFSANVSKSFVGSQTVRESCGKYYHEGRDITPIRWTVPQVSGGGTPKLVASLIGFANNCFEVGYAALRRLLIRRILYDKLVAGYEKRGYRDERGRLRIAFVTDPDQFGILTSYLLPGANAHLLRRRSEELQVSRWRSLVVKQSVVRVREVFAHEAYSLLLYWRTRRSYEGVTKHGHEDRLPEETRFGWGWTPIQ